MRAHQGERIYDAPFALGFRDEVDRRREKQALTSGELPVMGKKLRHVADGAAIAALPW